MTAPSYSDSKCRQTLDFCWLGREEDEREHVVECARQRGVRYRLDLNQEVDKLDKLFAAKNVVLT